ncbi:MAG TPA: TasA family protein [Candidatus Thermoplasmatota archaeon]|nr:TasA family protein [Candidatus Thermoplasmatota archaeon]
MNYRIIASLITIGVASAGLGYGTFAYFSDTEQALDNIFTAATLDLELDGADGISAKFNEGSFAPGDSATGTIKLTSLTNIALANLDLDFKAATDVTDDTGVAGDPDDGGASGAEQFDEWLILTTFTYGGTDLLPGIADSDGRPGISLADLEADGVQIDLAAPGAPAAGTDLVMTVLFDTAAPNHLKRDSVDLDLTFFLSQAAGADLA